MRSAVSAVRAVSTGSGNSRVTPPTSVLFASTTLAPDNAYMDTDFSRAWIAFKSLRRIGRSDWPFWLGACLGTATVSYWLLH